MPPLPPLMGSAATWAELPIVVWLVLAILVMLLTVGRFDWDRGRDVLSRYRLWWGASLTAAVVAALYLGFVSGEPLPQYF